MKDNENLHLKVQELCDCFANTDPLKEMSEIENDENASDAALKWLALTALHGINSNAKKITVKQAADGGVTVMAEYRDTELPSPGKGVGDHIFEAVKAITHIEGEKGKSKLAMGVRDSSLDLDISVKNKEEYKKISIKFP